MIKFRRIVCASLLFLTGFQLMAGDISLPSLFVKSVDIDIDNNVWIGTEEGVCRFNGIDSRFFFKGPEGLGGNQVNFLFADRQRPYVWVAARYGGLTRIDIHSGETFIYMNEEGNASSLPNNDVTYIDEDSDGNIWISTYSRGIARLDFENGTFTTYSHEDYPLLKDSDVRAIKVKDNSIFLGYRSNGIGIFHLDGRDPEYFPPAGSEASRAAPVSSETHDLFFDSYDNLWISGNWGLSLFSPRNRKFVNFVHNNSTPGSLPPGPVRSVRKLDENKLLVSTDLGGLYSLDMRSAIFAEENIFTPVHIDDRQYVLSMRSACADRFGNIWCGTYGYGLLFCGRRNETVRMTPSPLSVNYWDNYQLALDDNGEIVKAIDSARYPTARVQLRDGDKVWTGNFFGLELSDASTGKVLRTFGRDEGLGDTYVQSIAKDARGRLWVGTYARGIFVFDSEMKVVANLKVNDDMVGNTINQIVPARDGTMLIASGSGLLSFDPGTDSLLYRHGRSEGLANEFIRTVVEDRSGNIWMSTGIGVSCLTADGRILNFNAGDKIPDGNFFRASGILDTDGKVCLGTSEGICRIDPAQMLRYSDLPKVSFVDIDKELIVSPKNKYVSIKFVVPDYSFNGSLEYEYRISDLSSDWHSCSTELTFDHLPYGWHNLEVRARLRQQEWDEDIANLRIYCARPFWASGWAVFFYALIASLLIFAIVRHVVRKSRSESQKKYEHMELVRKQELNAERMNFFTNITHELRTPLTLILGPLDDMKSDKSLPPATRKRISNAGDNAHRLLEMINQLLDFQKTETADKKLAVRYGNFSSFIRETGTRFSELDENGKVSFHLEIEPGIEMWFDPGVIYTIVSNILSNARKYTPEGYIELCLRRGEGSDVLLSVTDTGYGMPEEELGRIFDRYYQINGKHQASGTGIGLSLVKNLCEMHHIAIDVKSKLNQGSCFTLKMNSADTYPGIEHMESDDPEDRQEETEEEETSDDRLSILVVEDNSGICNYISESLSDNYRVITASDGREGLKLALREIPDIVITDIMMPNMDGISLCKALKSDIRTSHIPVIMLTAKTSDESRKEGYDVGADSFLVKPFNRDLILSRIGNIVANRQRIAEKLNKGEDTVELSAMDNGFLREFNSLVLENIANENLSLQDIASKLCMSQSTLYRKIKAVTGITPVENIRNIRLNKAAELLRSSDQTISEIAWSTGFGSPVYFRDCFKERYGKTPSAYRSEHPLT